MAAHQETFKGHDIEIDDDDNLKIGGQPVEVYRSEDGLYSTNYLPYTQYETIVDMAREVIDKAADFDTLSA